MFKVEELCRVCLLTSSNLTPLNIEDSDTITLYEKFVRCVPEVVELERRFSSKMCQSCVDQLKSAYQFRENCIKSTNSLKICMRDQISDDSVASTTTNDSGLSTTLEEGIGNDNFTDPNTISQIAQKSVDIDVNNTSSVVQTRRYDCTKCHQKFLSFVKLKRHKCKHLTCPECHTFHTSNRRQLHTHMRVQHQKAPLYKCKKCPQTFHYPVTLRLHQQRHHTSHITNENGDGGGGGDNDTIKTVFKCPVCGICLAEESGINSHLGTHMVQKGIRPKSSVNNDLKQPSAYKCIRMRILLAGAKNTTQCVPKRYYGECANCKEAFVSKNEHRWHICDEFARQIYTCHVCQKSFLCTSLLERHVRAHTQVKPFECSTCGRRFTGLVSLKRHLRFHESVRDFMAT